MADAKISALTALASGHATGDLIPLVDVSDTTQAASGTTKHTTLANLLANLPGPTNAVGISHTGQSLTGSNAQSLVNLTATWNTTGTPTALFLNITDTASNAASKLLDLQVGSATQFNVDKAGAVTCGRYVYFNKTTSANVYLDAVTSSTLDFYTSGALQLRLGADSVVMGGAFVGLGATATAPDIGLYRTAAGIGRITASSAGSTGAALEFIEQTAPGAPGANGVRLYAQDNGAGKTQLMALFNTGAAQQVAIEP